MYSILIIMGYHAVVFGSLSLVVLLVLQGTNAVSYGACPEEWQQWKGSCYKSLLNPMRTWKDAVEICNELDAHIATPNSKEEYDFMWEFTNSGLALSTGVWIGCTDEDGDGVWDCIGDTSDIHYRPDRMISPSPDRQCSVFSKIWPLWTSWSCVNDEKHVMCERPVPVITDSVSCSIVATNRCLSDHTFKTFTVRGKLQCCLACHKDQRCKSFNLRGNQCELSEGTHDVTLLVSDGDCVHYEL